MALRIKRPLLIVGAGGAGARLAAKTARLLGCDRLLIGGDRGDLPAEAGADSILVGTGPVINPTVHLVRAAAYGEAGRIRSSISGHPTTIMIGNLAGRTGCAVAPVVAEACRREGSDLLSFAIMPFGYEKSKIFPAGVALRRLRENSACTIAVDNDSLLESNPDLTPRECYEIADAAIAHVMGSLEMAGFEAAPPADGLLVASKDGGGVEESLRDALKALCGSVAPDAVIRSMLYVVGGENVPTGVLRSVSGLAECVLGGRGDADAGAGAGHPAAETATVAGGSPDESRVVMLSAVRGMAKFEGYDPLGVIPADRTLDWEMPECSIDYGETGIRQIE